MPIIAYLVAFGLLFFYTFAQAQENCTNGLDDDGDGLIDCYDPDCCGTAHCVDHYYNPCPNTYTCATDSFSGNLSLRQVWQNSTIVNNITNPVVGDLDGDGIPEIVATKLTASNNALVIIDSRTGQTIRTIAASQSSDNSYNSGIVLADINRDGQPEIIYPSGDRYVYCFTATGTQLWRSSQQVTTSWATVASVVDFNQDGRPEVYAGRYILNGQTGQVLGILSGSYGRTGGQTGIGDLATPIAVDALPDSFCSNCAGMELVAGNMVYSVAIDTTANTATLTIEVLAAGTDSRDGLTTVADWDRDGNLDGIVVYVRSSQVVQLYVWNLQTGVVLMRSNINRIGTNFTIGSSTPTVGDMDNDGQLEAAVVTNFRLVVVENDGTIKWSRSNSDRSGSTGTSLYDFNGDGQYELVYRDETHLTLFDANTGAIRTQTSCTSGTGTERAIVVDMDADGQTEILCTCNGFVAGQVTAFESGGTPWVPCRSLYNQYQYHATQINDDLTVPRYQQIHAWVGDSLVLNGFYNQYQNKAVIPLADAAVQVTQVQALPPDSVALTLQLCNLGDHPLPVGTPIAFYQGDPTSDPTAQLVTVIPSIGQTLAPGACHTLTQQLFDAGTLWYVLVNDNGSRAPLLDLNRDLPVTTIAECEYHNNLAAAPLLLSTDALELHAKVVADRQVRLDWSVPISIEPQTLWYSVDGIDFQPLTTIFEKTGYWNHYLPHAATEGYYQLSGVDASGASYYSKIVQVSLTALASPIRVSPNPFQDKLRIESPIEVVSVAMYDGLGRMVLTQPVAQSESLVLYLTPLPKGVYWLRLTLKDGSQQQRQVVCW